MESNDSIPVFVCYVARLVTNGVSEGDVEQILGVVRRSIVRYLECSSYSPFEIYIL